MPYESFYPILDRCYRLGRYLFEGIMYDWALWAGQDRILCALRPDGVTLQSELSRNLHMDPRTLHRSLEYLHTKSGYVRFRQSPTDMRVKAITMTSRGQFAASVAHHTYGIIAKQMCVGLSGAEVAELNRLLELATRREAELRARKLDLHEVLERGFF
jgi:DNA-binding MarR family transcriptional regulator